MGWQQYINRRNTLLFSAAALASSYYAVRTRQDQVRKLNRETFHVETNRSGGGI